MGSESAGNLILIGGNEDKERDCQILSEIVHLSGGSDSRILIVPTATIYPQESGEEYKSLFYGLGASQVNVLNIASRDEANSRKTRDELQHATAVFFTGGDQLRVTSLLGGTLFDKFLYNSFMKGNVIAGTSAGASVVTDTMIVEGKNDTFPTKNSVALSHGLSFLENTVIDQHFAERGRIGRLLSAVAQNPFIIGLGIDEDTAIKINSKNNLEVIGSGTVTVVDGWSITYSNVSLRKSSFPLTISDVTLHVLSPGYCFDLEERVVSREKEEEV